jgi:hypothetical protein
MRNVYTILVRKLEEKKLHGRARCRWEDNTKMTLTYQIDLTQNKDHWQTIFDIIKHLASEDIKYLTSESEEY